MPESPLLTYSKAQYEKQSALADKLRAYQFGQEIGREDVERKRAERKLAQDIEISLSLLNSTKPGSKGRIEGLRDFSRLTGRDVSGMIDDQTEQAQDTESLAKILTNKNVNRQTVEAAFTKYKLKYPGVPAPDLPEEKIDVTVGGQTFNVSQKAGLASATQLEGTRINKSGTGVVGVSKDQYNAAVKFMKFNIDAYLPGVNVEDLSKMDQSSFDLAIANMPQNVNDDMRKAYYVAQSYTDQSYKAAGGGEVTKSGDEGIVARVKAIQTKADKTKKIPEVQKKVKAVTDKQEIERLARVKRSATDELKMQALKASTQLNKNTVNELAETNPRGLLQLIKPKLSQEAYRKLVRELALPPEEKKVSVISKRPLTARQQRALQRVKNRPSSLSDRRSKSLGIKPTGAKL